MCILIWFLFYDSSLKVAGVTLPEGTAFRITECAGRIQRASCPSSDIIAIQSIYHGTKLTTTCSISNTTDPCCDYSASDCLILYNDTAQQTACSGRSLCEDVTVAGADTSSCGGSYPPINHYLTTEYYCITGSRISSMCASSSASSTGPSLLYIKNSDYPSALRSTDTSCSCSVEVSSCSSQIRVYLIHFHLGDGGDTCTGTQQVQINNDGSVETLTCSDNTDYEIVHKLTSTTNYLAVTQVNLDSMNDGYFWIGYGGTSGSDTLNVNCPAVNRTMCMDCPTLTAPTDGSLSTSTVTTGTTVTVSCNPSFTLDGAASLVCQTNGTWDNTVGVCRPDCPTLTAPADGSLSTAAVTTGTTVTVSCNPSFTLDGAATLFCQTNGNWDNTVGVCRSDCPILTAPADGSLSTSAVTTGTTVTVSCNPSFTLDGPATLVCQTNGNWDNTVGVCRPDCPGLSHPANGQVSPTTSVSTGQSATYTCNLGYSIIGSDTRTCQGDSTWSGSEPLCGPSCPVLTSPNNGQVSETGYSPGDTATYTCSTGYMLSGVTTRTCQADNTWSDSAPACNARVSDDGLSSGKIAGIVVGVIIVCVCVVLILGYFVYNKTCKQVPQTNGTIEKENPEKKVPQTNGTIEKENPEKKVGTFPHPNSVSPDMSMMPENLPGQDTTYHR